MLRELGYTGWRGFPVSPSVIWTRSNAALHARRSAALDDDGPRSPSLSDYDDTAQTGSQSPASASADRNAEDTETIQALLGKLRSVLDSVYANAVAKCSKSKGKRFNILAEAMIGRTLDNHGAWKGSGARYYGPHNIDSYRSRNLHVYMREVMDSTKPQWLKDCYRDVLTPLIKQIDPVWAGDDGDWAVQINIMDGADHINRHCDDKDISYQYGVALGSFTGGNLKVWNRDESQTRSIDVHNKIVRLDGRNPHEVEPFEGTRYSVYFFKVFDRREEWTTVAPITDDIVTVYPVSDHVCEESNANEADLMKDVDDLTYSAFQAYIEATVPPATAMSWEDFKRPDPKLILDTYFAPDAAEKMVTKYGRKEVIDQVTAVVYDDSVDWIQTRLDDWYKKSSASANEPESNHETENSEQPVDMIQDNDTEPDGSARSVSEYATSSHNGGCAIAALQHELGLVIPQDILEEADRHAVRAATTGSVSEDELRRCIGDPNDGGAYSVHHVTQILRLLQERRLILKYDFERLRGQPWEVCKQVREIINGRNGDAVIITGVLNRQTAEMIEEHQKSKGFKFPTTWAQADEMGNDRNDDFMHTILGRGGHFYCNNQRNKRGRMIAAKGKCLAIGKDGSLSEDSWRYMREIHRCYRIRTEVVTDEADKAQRLKRVRAQHADFAGAEVMSCTKPTAGFARAKRRRPEWASVSDPVYGHLGN